MNKKRIIVNSSKRNLPKGITPDYVRRLNVNRKNMPKIIKRNKPDDKPDSLPGKVEILPRPLEKFLPSLATKVERLNLPQRGSFNAGLVPYENGYICVYRPNEYGFIACKLDQKLRVDEKSYFKFSMTNCADPRVIWINNYTQLLMVYSSTSEVGFHHECIRGSIIMDLNKSERFIDDRPFRISPEGLETRQKNWMPFEHEGKIYLIGSVCPHVVYEMYFEGKGVICEKVAETEWLNPWIFKEFLRGNTNPVRLADGNYLGTFHTAVWHGSCCHYDNGCYLFEGKLPFRVIKCSNRTYLPSEGAIEPYYRKKNIIRCTFPVGMVRQEDKLLISYGDNDSAVKIMETTVPEMLDLMVEVY